MHGIILQIHPDSGRAKTTMDKYRSEYADYYKKLALKDSPAMRHPNPTVVLIPGIGMFSFGKNKTEARITGEFYVNAIHVMEGAGLWMKAIIRRSSRNPALRANTSAFNVHENYVALPPSEAFRIEYWALEEAKIRRQPAEKELSRRIVLVVAEPAALDANSAHRGATRRACGRRRPRTRRCRRNVAGAAQTIMGKENAIAVKIDIRDRGGHPSASTRPSRLSAALTS